MKTENNRLAACQHRTSREPEKIERAIKKMNPGGRSEAGSADDLGKFQKSLAKYNAQLHAVCRSTNWYTTGVTTATQMVRVKPSMRAWGNRA
jgi:hypothetical protein